MHLPSNPSVQPGGHARVELRQQLIISENKSILASVAGVQVSQKLAMFGEFCQATGARKYR